MLQLQTILRFNSFKVNQNKICYCLVLFLQINKNKCMQHFFYLRNYIKVCGSIENKCRKSLVFKRLLSCLWRVCALQSPTKMVVFEKIHHPAQK